jgi:hypothetical protein
LSYNANIQRTGRKNYYLYYILSNVKYLLNNHVKGCDEGIKVKPYNAEIWRPTCIATFLQTILIGGHMEVDLIA